MAQQGIDEVQHLSILGSPVSGTFTLTLDDPPSTAGIDNNPAASEIQSALEALGNIGVGNVSVVATGTWDFDITFCNVRGSQDIALLVADYSKLKPPGKTSVVITEVYQGSPPSILSGILAAQESANITAHAALVDAQLAVIAAKQASMAADPSVPAEKRVI